MRTNSISMAYKYAENNKLNECCNEPDFSAFLHLWQWHKASLIACTALSLYVL